METDDDDDELTNSIYLQSFAAFLIKTCIPLTELVDRGKEKLNELTRSVQELDWVDEEIVDTRYSRSFSVRIPLGRMQ